MSLASLKTGLHTSVRFNNKPPSAQTDLVDNTLIWTPTLINENSNDIKFQDGFDAWLQSWVNTTVNDNRRITPNDASKVFTPAQLNADHTWRGVVRNDHNIAETDMWVEFVDSGNASSNLAASPPSDTRLRVSAMSPGFTNIPNTGILGLWYQIVVRFKAASNLLEVFVNGNDTGLSLTTTQTFVLQPTVTLMNTIGFTQGPDGGIAEFNTWTRRLKDNEISTDLTGSTFNGTNFIQSGGLKRKILLGLI